MARTFALRRAGGVSPPSDAPAIAKFLGGLTPPARLYSSGNSCHDLRTPIAHCTDPGCLRQAGRRPTAQFAKEVRPFLAKYCTECHNADKPKGEFDLTTFKALMQGGKHGAAVVPGKPDESRLVTQTEHKTKPIMPPKKPGSQRLRKLAFCVLWVAAGAKDDSAADHGHAARDQAENRGRSAGGRIGLFAGRQAVGRGGQSRSAADRHGRRHPDRPASGANQRGHCPGIQSGRQASGGCQRFDRRVRRSADLRVGNGQVADKPEQTLAAHADIIHAVAFGPDGKVLATTGYDRLIKLWDVPSGKLLRTSEGP